MPDTHPALMPLTRVMKAPAGKWRKWAPHVVGLVPIIGGGSWRSSGRHVHRAPPAQERSGALAAARRLRIDGVSSGPERRGGAATQRISRRGIPGMREGTEQMEAAVALSAEAHSAPSPSFPPGLRTRSFPHASPQRATGYRARSLRLGAGESRIARRSGGVQLAVEHIAKTFARWPAAPTRCWRVDAGRRRGSRGTMLRSCPERTGSTGTAASRDQGGGHERVASEALERGLVETPPGPMKLAAYEAGWAEMRLRQRAPTSAVVVLALKPRMDSAAGARGAAAGGDEEKARGRELHEASRRARKRGAGQGGGEDVGARWASTLRVSLLRRRMLCTDCGWGGRRRRGRRRRAASCAGCGRRTRIGVVGEAAGAPERAATFRLGDYRDWSGREHGCRDFLYTRDFAHHTAVSGKGGRIVVLRAQVGVPDWYAVVPLYHLRTICVPAPSPVNLRSPKMPWSSCCRSAPLRPSPCRATITGHPGT
ncbi:hypothetical protein B0H17DRAFT_1134693 [Mycena rosella]|uniref:Uncharacterized protein n=1 Tax=Mycena rosella TaxID=1033263 RepID=A0AAD7DEU5_MYCRO|nr:hypothetical protein B0H17DRAFT_1134693 [Mycena rosella]